jgi:hypothetical protein
VHGNQNMNIITNNSPINNRTFFPLGGRRNFILKQNKSDFELILYEENTDVVSRKITLSMQRWKMLSEIIDTISDCFDAICKKKVAEMFYHLGGGVHVKLGSPYMVVHIRKYYYSKDDQVLPTPTGVAMRYDEYRDLKVAMIKINSSLKMEKITSCSMSPINHVNKTCEECFPFQKSNNKSFMQNLILK